MHYLNMNAFTIWFILNNKRNTLSDDAFTIYVHNVRSLLQHADDVVSDDRIINNDIIGLTKTKSFHQILLSR